MNNSADFTVKHTDSRRYVIECRNMLYKFHLAASYKKKNDSWEIGSIDPPHSCIATNVEQDHRKLSATSTYNYTPSYKKAWIASTKAVEQIFGNWEDSYKELPWFLWALKTYVPRTVAIMETLPAIMSDGTCVTGNRIFHRLFWAFDLCIKGFASCKPIIQIDGTWLCGKYKGTLLMVVAQDGNNNVFPISFALIEGETAGGWGFFLRHLRMHVASQANLCLISDRHAAIESAYNNHDNG
ncbi:hypothetical protein KIW84_015573 [Lathyrus oleraceus]|uniref:MULE transposase domain-containing protein n=1 Tax=Pisum sativum TaxID=3888 RepID=A0A9D5H0L9_PEA|nr:hypothetical protein KIW84_015573 [Pisum sativum]